MLQRARVRRLPVDPYAIAGALGIELRAIGTGFLKVAPSGHFYYDQHGNPVIEYNTAEPPQRRRFTVAHELGHYALGHRDAPRDSSLQFNSGVVDPRERAANQFAAELLMPWDFVKEVFYSGLARTAEQMAQEFGVSSAAMGYRLKNLGLIT